MLEKIMSIILYKARLDLVGILNAIYHESIEACVIFRF